MEKEYCIITTACNKKEIADKIIETLLEKKVSLLLPSNKYK